MTIARRTAVVAGLCAMLIPLGFEGFARVTCYGAEGGWGDLILMGPSLLIALGCLATSNPLRSLGASLGLTMVLWFMYHRECVAPYVGGGASFLALLIFFAAPIGAGFGAWIAETICLIFRFRIAEGEVEVPNAR